MAKGMWLEHPEGQEQAEQLAIELRALAQGLPDGPSKRTVRDAAAFLGAISDPDNPPLTTEELSRFKPYRVKQET
ncbi:MAG: hypothetical protein AAF580_11315 [Pseudomonadota bacterium]